MEAIKKALANCEQNLSADEQAQCRSNIGAQAQLTAGTNVTIDSDNVISSTDTTYTAGTNVSISDQNVISATDTTYSAGAGLNLNGTEFSVDTNTIQAKLTAGSNISINGSTISATDTTYGVFNTTTDGLVPKASGTGDTGKFLKGDGTWDTPTDTTYNVFNTTTDGLVPKASGTGDTGKFLKGDGTWEAINAPSIVQKKDYGDTSASTVSTLLIDSDDPEGYAVVKCDGSNKGALVVGPYKTMLDSGVNGVGDSSTPVYIDGNGSFATCSITPGGAKRSNTAELYFHHSQDGDHYNVRNVKNYCINHVAVNGHSGDICYVEIEAPTLDGTGEEYDYVVVFDCVNSSGSTTHVVVQNADPEIFTYPLDSTSHVVQITQTLVYFDGAVRSQIEVLGGRFTVHSY